jgi:ribosomal protein S18 acetylase RimI-like enzyme
VSTELRPASSLGRERLAGLFTAGFEGYFVPISADAAALAAMVESWDLDLDASPVAFVGGEPVGFALLGVRGTAGWIGGMGVVAGARRRGVGAAVGRAVLEEARRRGLAEVRLEVLVQNDAARRLYDRLGFEPVRELEIWAVERASGTEPQALSGASRARSVGIDEARATITRLRREREPWQRADETVARVPDLRAVAVEGGAALYRVTAARASILQLAVDADLVAQRHLPDPARELLSAILGDADGAVWVNVPAGDPALGGFRELGGRVTERQVEMIAR